VLVVGAGLCVLGAAAWNLRKSITRSFLDNLDLGRLDEKKRHVVRVAGVVGYAARAGAFGLVGWFLIQAGLKKNPNETRGLDGSLRSLLSTTHGSLLLFALALGLIQFGAFRILDGIYRKPHEITYA
jgi:hypothetical protein